MIDGQVNGEMSSYLHFSQKRRADLDRVGLGPVEELPRNRVQESMFAHFEEMKPKWRAYCSYFRMYPDVFLDFIAPPKPLIRLYFYQRVYLRAMMRYQRVYITATRGSSKSFLQNVSFVLRCIMYPRTKLFTCAVGKEQAARITAANVHDIFKFYPLLRQEVKTFTTMQDYTKLVFYNGSEYDVVQIRDSTRGGRRHGGCIEEVADKKFDGDKLNSVVIPLMAVDRVAGNGKVDKNEIHKTEMYITTAGSLQQFAYEKMVEVFQDMLDGKSAICIGNSYELPCLHQALDADFIEEKRMSPTFSTMDFMREYESIWTGSSADSLVADVKLAKSRTCGVAEFEHDGSSYAEYVLAYDVSRNEGDQNAMSCLVVIKLTPRADGDYLKEVVNLYSMEGTHFLVQAKFLKEKVADYRARVLVIDSNGIGSSVVDHLVLDLHDGNPPYSVLNDERYDKYKLEHSIPMVFSLKAQNRETKNSDMINHFMKSFNNLDVSLLKSAHEGVKDYEKKHKVKVKDSEELALVEVPYLLTDVLCSEIMNLKYKQSGNTTKTERVSTRIKQDKFSALMYGLYWVYLLEQKGKMRRRVKVGSAHQYFLVRKPKMPV